MTTPRKGMPGLKGTDHIGFTVPDLDAAIDFFVNVIGCEPFYELGPFASDGDWMQTHLNVHPRTVMKKLRFLRCRNGANFEVFASSSTPTVPHAIAAALTALIGSPRNTSPNSATWRISLLE